MTTRTLAIGIGGVRVLGTIGVAKSYARVTPLLWISILTGDSSRGMVVWTLSSSRGGEGVRVKVLPVFFFLWCHGQSAGVGFTIVTLSPQECRQEKSCFDILLPLGALVQKGMGYTACSESLYTEAMDASR